MRWPTRILRVLVGAAFFAAGAGKLVSDGGVRLAPILAAEASGPVMIATMVIEEALPALEILAALATWIGAGIIGRSAITVLLGAGFVAVALRLPEGVRCGCFGILGGFVSREAHIAASSGLLAAALLLFGLELRCRRRATRPCGTVGYGRQAGSDWDCAT